MIEWFSHCWLKAYSSQPLFKFLPGHALPTVFLICTVFKSSTANPDYFYLDPTFKIAHIIFLQTLAKLEIFCQKFTLIYIKQKLKCTVFLSIIHNKTFHHKKVTTMPILAALDPYPNRSIGLPSLQIGLESSKLHHITVYGMLYG
jgi:hypothetical protein